MAATPTVVDLLYSYYKRGNTSAQAERQMRSVLPPGLCRSRTFIHRLFGAFREGDLLQLSDDHPDKLRAAQEPKPRPTPHPNPHFFALTNLVKKSCLLQPQQQQQKPENQEHGSKKDSNNKDPKDQEEEGVEGLGEEEPEVINVQPEIVLVTEPDVEGIAAIGTKVSLSVVETVFLHFTRIRPLLRTVLRLGRE